MDSLKWSEARLIFTLYYSTRSVWLHFSNKDNFSVWKDSWFSWKKGYKLLQITICKGRHKLFRIITVPRDNLVNPIYKFLCFPIAHIIPRSLFSSFAIPQQTPHMNHYSIQVERCLEPYTEITQSEMLQIPKKDEVNSQIARSHEAKIQSSATIS